MRERRLWMVKTDIEYATLYAALLLRMRNPNASDFTLTWPLTDSGQTAAPPVIKAPHAAATSAATASSTTAAVAASMLPAITAGEVGGGSVTGPASSEGVTKPLPVAEMDGGRVAGGSGGGGGLGRGPAGGALKVVTPEDEDEMEVSGDEMAAGDGEIENKEQNTQAGTSAACDISDPTDVADAEATMIDNETDVAHYGGVGMPASPGQRGTARGSARACAATPATEGAGERGGGHAPPA